MRGVLPWLVRLACRAGTIEFYPAFLAALVPPKSTILHFPHRTLFHFYKSRRPATWAGSRAGSPVSVSPVHIQHLNSKNLDRSNHAQIVDYQYSWQCCGCGSVCFWNSWIRIHQSEVLIRIRIRILLSPSKNSKKNLDSYCFVTSF